MSGTFSPIGVASENLRQPHGHLGRNPALLVYEFRQGRARDSERGGGGRDRQAQRLNTLAPHKAAGVGWILHRHGSKLRLPVYATRFFPWYRPGLILIVVNGAPMPYGHHQHHQPRFLQLTDYAVIPHPIPPQSKLAGAKRFAEMARVIGRGHP